ncbi:MAG: NADH-quinone oxidoreductase subunit B family protein [Candidatus Thorarchaeota archaeon]|jgi:F420-non-reducing hydrogenase small subunit
MADPVSIAMAQGSSCWGCYQSLVDIHLKLADVLPLLDIKYWQAVVDYKLSDLEGYPDKSIAVGLFEGMARTEEDIHLLKIMRNKCQTLIAFGSCSCFGGIPALANQYDLEDCLEVKFRNNKTFEGGKVPTENVPRIESVVKPNSEFATFDIHLPGCPPTSSLILTAVTALLEGKPIDLPPHAVCHYCDREKKEEPIEDIKRPFEGIADPDRCLLEQGYICVGSSTWGLCEGQCVNKGVTCRGCFGPVPPIMKDHGAATISMLGSYAPNEPEKLVQQVKDPLGTFWRVDYATSHLGSMRIRREGVEEK